VSIKPDGRPNLTLPPPINLTSGWGTPWQPAVRLVVGITAEDLLTLTAVRGAVPHLRYDTGTHEPEGGRCAGPALPGTPCLDFVARCRLRSRSERSGREVSAPVDGPAAMASATDPSEGFGERLLDTTIERAHEMPPHLIAPLVAEVIAAIGGRHVAVLLPDYDQLTLVSLPGQGLVVEQPEPIEDSAAGGAFLGDALVEQPVQGGVRLLVPMLDGTDRVGVLAFTGDSPSEDDRRLARRFAGLLADVLITKGMYTDRFFQARRRQPMSLSAEMQYALLPPLMMTTAQVAIAGILEPAYRVGGQLRLRPQRRRPAPGDHRRNGARPGRGGDGDGRRRGLPARPTGRGRPARPIRPDGRRDRRAVRRRPLRHRPAGPARRRQRPPAVAQHRAPRPLLWRPEQAVRALRSPTTLPVGIGGGTPAVGQERLQRRDRVLFYTDGIIEERLPGGEQFGGRRLLEQFTQAEQAGGPVQQTVRRLSHTLLQARGGTTSDDATLFLLQWRSGDTSHLAALEQPAGRSEQSRPNAVGAAGTPAGPVQTIDRAS
jgi:hypothetical protein